MLLKKDILSNCFRVVHSRIDEIKLSIADVEKSLFSDTKSSAGDKYETGREMLQQDLDRYANQLLIANQDLQILNNIDLNRKYIDVRQGALIKTEKFYFFIGISIGQLIINGNTVYIISSHSPIGKSLIGLTINEVIRFNNLDLQILNIE